MKTNKLSLFLFLGLMISTIACKKEEEAKPAPKPTPVPKNEVTFNGASKEITHAYVVAFEEDLDIDGEAYRYFEVYMANRNISAYFSNEAGGFDLDDLTSEALSNNGDSYLFAPIAIKSSAFSSVEGTYNVTGNNNSPVRFMGTDCRLFWNFNKSTLDFANTMLGVSETINSVLNIKFNGSINNNSVQDMEIEGFFTFMGLSNPVPYRFKGAVQYFSTDFDPNDL
jgi:hypothetical protein